MTYAGAVSQRQKVAALVGGLAALGSGAAVLGDDVVRGFRTVAPAIVDDVPAPRPDVPSMPRIPAPVPSPEPRPYRPPGDMNIPPRPPSSTVEPIQDSVTAWARENQVEPQVAREVIGGLLCDIFVSLAMGEGVPSGDELLQSQAVSGLPIGARRGYAVAHAQQEAFRLQQSFNRNGVELGFAVGEVCSYAVSGRS